MTAEDVYTKGDVSLGIPLIRSFTVNEPTAMYVSQDVVNMLAVMSDLAVAPLLYHR